MNTLVFLCVWAFLLGQSAAQSFCDDDCDCDYSYNAISCSGVDFNEALRHDLPRSVADVTTSLRISYFDQTLKLSNNTLQRFPALKSLEIKSYTIGYISGSAFAGFENLNYVYLYLNGLKEFPKRALSRLSESLEELHLVYQHFTHIPAYAFTGFTNLRILDISQNIQFLDVSARAFEGLANMTILSLSSGNIQHLSDTTFMTLTHLRKLDLSYNLFREVPSALNSIHSLQTLDLSHNTYLNNSKELAFLMNMPDLKTLQFRYCAISHISPGAVEKLEMEKALTTANFDGNPFNCSTELCPFVNWYLNLPRPTTTRSPYFIPFITISPPPGSYYQCRNGQSFQDFYRGSCLPTSIPVNPSSNPNNLADDVQWQIVIIVVVIIVTLFVVLVASFVIWRFRLANQYRPFRVRQRIRSENADEQREYLFDAYVSHHDDDKAFVEDEILPRLEDEQNFELCVSFRNFRLGSNRMENITSALDVSRVTIFLINERFMHNGQCKLELEMASTAMLEDERGPDNERPRIILLLMEEIPGDLMNHTLRLLLNHVTYLEWVPAAQDRCWGQLVATLRALVPERNLADEHPREQQEQEHIQEQEPELYIGLLGVDEEEHL